MRTPTLTILTFLAASTASATIYLGNPELEFRVDRAAGDYIEGTVDLEKVVVHHCGGGSTTYDVDETIDPVAGYSLDIDAGNHCSVTYHWDSNMVIEGPAYEVSTNASTTTVTLADTIPHTLMTPCQVISGTMTGSCPWLMMRIE